MSDGKINILVVDDLPEKLLAMETILEELGENVVTARSGRESLRRLLERDFAVILLDVNMPDMDGFETATMIRQRRRFEHTPIIFITAFSDEMHMAQGYSLGAVDYILSPVIPEVLRTKVRVFVDLFRKNEQVKQQAEERIALARAQAARAAAEEATRRSTFLAEASKILVRSLDYETTLRDLARLPIPFLGDVSAVSMLEEHGAPWKTRMAFTDSSGGPCHLELVPERNVPGALASAIQRVLATGKSELVAQIGEPTEMDPTQHDEPGAPGAALAGGSALIVPLQARSKVLGALTLARGPGNRYTPDDLVLAEDLAGRAAIAIDNARLYRDIQEGDRRKDEFLAMLSHELRNPLAPIRNAVHVLQLSALEQPGLQWAREVIDRQVKQMVRLVDDLLDVSRITRGKVKLQTERIDVATVVALAVETSRPLIEARKHQLAVSLPPESVKVEADPARLAQVLANLLNNAAKYTREGGQISLTVRREDRDVVFRVRDTGIGIPPEMLASIFDLFTQVDHSLDRSQGGLGIGLTLVRRLVELHGGNVQVRSEGPDQGSEFIVRLPALPDLPSPEMSLNGEHVNTASPSPRRILVVDDNVDAAHSLAMLLGLEGHQVQMAHDGPSALQAAEAFRPQVVLLDIGLPGMDGYEVARRLRQKPDQDNLVLIALTGYGQEEDRSRSREAGFDHHLVKPADLLALARLFNAPTSR